MPNWEYLTLEAHRDVPHGAGVWLVSTSDGLFRDTRMSEGPGAIVRRLRAEGWELISGEPGMISTGDAFVAAFKRRKVEG